MHRYAAIVIVLFFTALVTQAQPVSPVSFGMGGAGATILNGLDAIGINPANLYLQTKGERFSATGYAISLFENISLALDGKTETFDALRMPFSSFTTSRALEVSSNTFQRRKNRLFAGDVTTGVLSAQQDVLLAAAALRFKGRTAAFFIRQRNMSDARISKTWYENARPPVGGTSVRFLEQQFRNWTEIGTAFSSEISVITGLHPNFNQLVFGFSPRFILAGSRFDGFLEETYLRNATSGTRTVTTRTTTAGFDSRFGWNSPMPASADYGRESLVGAGYGTAFDVGLTYVIPGGEDFSLFNAKAPAGYLPGLRISAAIRDLGLIRWNKNVRSETLQQTSSLEDAHMLPLDTVYSGQPGSWYRFASARGLSGNGTPQQVQAEQLPATLQTGISASNRWITLALESRFRTLALVSDAETFQWHCGLEFRLLRWLPVRAGLMYQRGLPLHFSAGLGLNTHYLQADAGVFWIADPEAPGGRHVTGAAMRATLRF